MSKFDVPGPVFAALVPVTVTDTCCPEPVPVDAAGTTAPVQENHWTDVQTTAAPAGDALINAARAAIFTIGRDFMGEKCARATYQTDPADALKILSVIP